MITFTDYQLSMAISRAYNAGKQNIVDMKDNGESAFIGSDDYFKSEFPKEWNNMNTSPPLSDEK